MACKLHIARLAAARGRHDEALAVRSALMVGLQKRYTASRPALNDRVRLPGRGDARSARWALRTRCRGRIQTLTSPAAELEAMALARVLIAEDRPDAALRILTGGGAGGRKAGCGVSLRSAAAIRPMPCASPPPGRRHSPLCAPQNALRILIDEGSGLRDVPYRAGRAELVRRHAGRTLYRPRRISVCGERAKCHRRAGLRAEISAFQPA
jgi:LuxR family maltose regulon positive regulatory protein